MADHRAGEWNTIEFWKMVGGNVIIGALALMFPAGIVLAIWFNDPIWLFLTLFSLIIFMAG